MDITYLFAGVAVSDYASASAWYEELLVKPPDMTPTPDEAVWGVTQNGSLYIVVDTQRAGRSLVTLAVDDLEACVARLEQRGMGFERIGGNGGPPRIRLSDPDGNTVQLFEDPAGARGGP